MNQTKNHPTSTWTSRHDGKTYQFTWINDSDVDKYQPCTQAYGICFDKEGRILVIDNKGLISIPGGTPEAGETPMAALKRELVEEADITVSRVIPLGVQRVGEADQPDKPPYYQYRFVCLIDEIMPQTPDPDNGITHPRFFYPSEEITQYVKWGTPGDAMFADAIRIFREIKQ